MTGISYLKYTRRAQKRGEPRNLRANSDDLCVCTACRWYPTTARRSGPPACPGPWSEIRVGIRRFLGHHLPQLKENWLVSSLRRQRTIAALGLAGDDGQCERRKPTYASKKSGGVRSWGRFRAVSRSNYPTKTGPSRLMCMILEDCSDPVV